MPKLKSRNHYILLTAVDGRVTNETYWVHVPGRLKFAFHPKTDRNWAAEHIIGDKCVQLRRTTLVTHTPVSAILLHRRNGFVRELGDKLGDSATRAIRWRLLARKPRIHET